MRVIRCKLYVCMQVLSKVSTPKTLLFLFLVPPTATLNSHPLPKNKAIGIIRG